MCGPKFCSMKITQDVREYAANLEKQAEQKVEVISPADYQSYQTSGSKVDEIAQQMAQKSVEFKATGSSLYHPKTLVEVVE